MGGRQSLWRQMTRTKSYLVRRWKETNEHKHPDPQDLWDALETKLRKAELSGNASDPWNRAFGPTHRGSKALNDHAARCMRDFDWGGTRTEAGRAGKRKQQEHQQLREDNAAAGREPMDEPMDDSGLGLGSDSGSDPGSEADDKREHQGNQKRQRENESSPGAPNA